MLLLVSVVLSAREFVKRWQRLVMARGDLRSITTAVQRYHARYNVWPAPPSHSGDIHYGRVRSNSEVMNVLRAVSGTGNPDNMVNSNRVVFLDVAPAAPGLSGLDAQGAFLDPWGHQYHIVLDLDYDNVCFASDTIYCRIQGQGVIAWSCGPDGKSDTDDDLLGWKYVITRLSAEPPQM